MAGYNSERFRKDALAGVTAESGPEGVQWQVHLRIAQARLATAPERVSDAVVLTEDAVALADRTDDLSLRGDAMTSLANALSASGRSGDAVEARSTALALYESKGNVAAAEALVTAPTPPPTLRVIPDRSIVVSRDT